MSNSDNNHNRHVVSETIAIADYCTGFLSRCASTLGRKEVLGGKAKFGIFGDGKEVAQLAMARAFRHGDWRAGYYRDQTFMFAIKACTVKQFFAQLYADASERNEPASGGRQMNCHFATSYLEKNGSWKNQTRLYNSSADISPTAGQMARLLGLAFASKLYRNAPSLLQWKQATNFSIQGNELAFGTIGNASTSEGLFWESVNAAGVLQVPMLLSIWDDEYGISVPNDKQMTKGNISKILQGFSSEEQTPGISLYQCPGYDYQKLFSIYQRASEKCRSLHEPCIIHVSHMTQPQGHSTSGSHERYKSKERLRYEMSHDCLASMREWILKKEFTTEESLQKLELEIKDQVESEKDAAWREYQSPIIKEKNQALNTLKTVSSEIKNAKLQDIVETLKTSNPPLRKDIQSALEKASLEICRQRSSSQKLLAQEVKAYRIANNLRYSSHLVQQNQVKERDYITPLFSDQSNLVDGRLIINKFFDQALATIPESLIIGEDVGKLGGVNLEFEGLLAKHGPFKIQDTGIREATILGQGIGAAMRGLRPIVDIQYLDYLLYALQGMSDDLATLHYRSAGKQIAPVIIRTKGHRLEGIWHTGSPIGMILGAIRGIYLCVPRNCVQAAGMYKTLLGQNNPGLVIEVLNGYRIKERCPSNIGQYYVPLGQVEILRPGNDITLITYGANVRLALEACSQLESFAISVELIDVQTLLPFDNQRTIKRSVEKTNAIVFLDEDVPGGSCAYMMHKVLIEQDAYTVLDAPPRNLSANSHRAAYGSDGDYFSKPNIELIVRSIYEMMHERSPLKYPIFT